MNQKDIAQYCLQMLDLTRLNNDDDESSIKHLCQKAFTPYGNVAAVCVFPEFIPLAQSLLSQHTVKLATVVNFPEGNQDKISILQTTKSAITNGANEIDIVLPYQDYMAGNTASALDIISSTKEVCGNHVILKVILETGILAKPDLIYKVSCDVIQAGADFLKTSTGKTSQGASIIAAENMLRAIKEAHINNPHIGIKISGGIRTLEQATSYIQLASTVMGDDWITATHFRIGASSLLTEILSTLS